MAAESISSASGRFDQRARELWLLASNLYSSNGNAGNGEDFYGWATLRASVLHGLSLHGKNLLCSEAAEQLLKLLSEISPENVDALDDAPVDEDANDEDMGGILDASQRSSTAYSEKKGRFSSIKQKAGFFSQIQKNSSLLNVQSKWIGDDVIPPTQVPLVEASEMSQLVISLSCVWPNVNFSKCSLVQKHIIGHIFSLRKALPAFSLKESTFFSGSDSGNDRVPPPVYVASAAVEESESSKSLERIVVKKNVENAMSTFFNPFAKKGKGGSGKVMLIAEGEERFVSITFGNLLSVPLEVPSCQIEFDHNDKWRILATSMSFVVPAKATNFSVQFPFTAISRERAMETEGGAKSSERDSDTFENKEDNVFVMKGLNVTCLGRSSFVPIHEKIDVTESLAKMKSLPEPASVYLRLSEKTKPEPEKVKLQFEIVPSQPKLVVSCASIGSFVEEDNAISIYLSDGEIFTTEPFYLENHVNTDRNNYGVMERLQIVAVGLSGHRDELLFDTVPIPPKEELPNRKGKKIVEPELKMKVLCDELTLGGINDPNQRRDKGNKVAFQIDAAHEFVNQPAGGRNVRIRFRYRGKSSNPGTEIWRQSEISLK